MTAEIPSGQTRTDPPQPPSRRKRNQRGQGYLLREDIIAAAAKILERTGSEDAVTLRAVAREVGIAAPSIDAHFAHRTEIIDAVVAKEAALLHQLLQGAAQSAEDPTGRLLAMCRTYVDYGRSHPGRYRMMVGRRFVEDWQAEDRVMETAPLLGALVSLVVEAVQACIDTGASSGGDAYIDTVVLWFTLHGLISIPPAFTSLSWPDLDDLLVTCVGRAVRLTGP